MARRPRRRPLRALGAGMTAAALLAGGGQAIAAPDVALDFTEAIDGTLPDADGQGTGFTTWLEGSGDDPTTLDLVTAGDGLLNVTTTAGDAAASPCSQDNALLARLDAGLTGGDVRDGAVTAGKLAPGVTVTATAATPPVPPSTTRIAAATRGSGGPVSATVAQLRINQRISQAAVRRSNALIERLSRGLTGADFQAGSLNATDLSPGLRQPPAS